MLVKCSCQYCAGHLEFDDSHVDTVIKCPHCGNNTRLYRSRQLSDSPVSLPSQFPVPDGSWVDKPMSDKQKAMCVLYGLEVHTPLTKGQAATIIDEAVLSGVKPTPENQAKAGVLFGHIRLKQIVQELTEAINIIGNEDANITTLKEAKKSIKDSVKALTDIIDKRIAGVRSERLERAMQDSP